VERLKNDKKPSVRNAYGKQRTFYISKEVIQVLVKEGLEGFNEKINTGDQTAQIYFDERKTDNRLI
jgi:hypothetical protein